MTLKKGFASFKGTHTNDVHIAVVNTQVVSTSLTTGLVAENQHTSNNKNQQNNQRHYKMMCLFKTV